MSGEEREETEVLEGLEECGDGMRGSEEEESRDIGSRDDDDELPEEKPADFGGIIA